MARQAAQKQSMSTPSKPQERASEHTVTALRGSPSHEQIARRAYEIFMARGGRHGSPEQDWFQAERELRLGRQ